MVCLYLHLITCLLATCTLTLAVPTPYSGFKAAKPVSAKFNAHHHLTPGYGAFSKYPAYLAGHGYGGAGGFIAPGAGLGRYGGYAGLGLSPAVGLFKVGYGSSVALNPYKAATQLAYKQGLKTGLHLGVGAYPKLKKQYSRVAAGFPSTLGFGGLRYGKYGAAGVGGYLKQGLGFGHGLAGGYPGVFPTAGKLVGAVKVHRSPVSHSVGYGAGHSHGHAVGGGSFGLLGRQSFTSYGK